jgi:hypothetical protein
MLSRIPREPFGTDRSHPESMKTDEILIAAAFRASGVKTEA